MKAWLLEEVNAAKEPRWKAWAWKALAVPLYPFAPVWFARLTQGSWAH